MVKKRFHYIAAEKWSNMLQRKNILKISQFRIWLNAQIHFKTSISPIVLKILALLQNIQIHFNKQWGKNPATLLKIKQASRRLERLACFGDDGDGSDDVDGIWVGYARKTVTIVMLIVKWRLQFTTARNKNNDITRNTKSEWRRWR